MLTLDHIAVLGTDLAAATQRCEDALGIAMGPGGHHARFGTHNRLIGLPAGIYLEAVAVDPEAPPPPDARWFGLDDFTGPARLDKWICRVPDIAGALQALPEAGRPIHVTRGDLSWTMAVPETGHLPWDGLFPALIEWHVSELPGDRLPKVARQLDRLTVTHPDAAGLQARLAPLLADARIAFVPGARASLGAQFTDGEQTWML